MVRDKDVDNISKETENIIMEALKQEIERVKGEAITLDKRWSLYISILTKLLIRKEVYSEY